MHTEHWGTDDPAAPHALLVHGITSSGATMWELGEALAAAGWSVDAPDLPGHGETPASASLRFADVADAVVDQFGTGHELYVGHSLGGVLGTVLLARHRDLARRAVLVDPPLRSDDSLRAEIPAALRRDQQALDPAAVAAEHPAWSPRTVAERVRSTAQADVDAVTGWLEQNGRWDVTAQASEVVVPVHVLVASDGSALAPGVAEQVGADNPRWTFEVVPDSTHSVHRDQPQLVVERLLAPGGSGVRPVPPPDRGPGAPRR